MPPRGVTTQIDQTHSSSVEAELQELRERLAAEGLHGTQLAEALDVARHIAAQPGQAERVRNALRDPAALAERLRAVAPRPNTAGAALGSIVLGALAGLPLAYAALGDVWHTYPAGGSRWIAGLVGGTLVLLLLAFASRYRHPGVLGALAGAAGGLFQVAVASIPWLALAMLHPACGVRGACAVAPAVGLIYALVAASLYAVPLTLTLATVASTVGYWAERHSVERAIRHAVTARAAG
ncbi:MAG: hypothetical protein PVSMB4_17860 [Ktedonobacterales bacterium]